MNALFIAALALLAGLAFCFFDYHVFLVMLPILGFFAGFWLGAEVVGALFGLGFLATISGWVVGFFTGLLFAILAYVFYTTGIALVAGSIGYGLAAGLLVSVGLESGILLFALELLTAVIGAALVLFLNVQKYVIIVLSAIAGANALVLSPLLIEGRVSLAELESVGNAIRPVLVDSWFWLIVWLALTVVGVIFQLRTNRTYVFDPSMYPTNWG